MKRFVGVAVGTLAGIMLFGGGIDAEAAGAPGVYVTPQDRSASDIVSIDWSPVETPPYTYWAVHNWNQGREGGGYAGFQQKTGNDASGVRTLHFAIWDPISTSTPIEAEYLSENSTTSRFGGEGTGRNVATTYPWDNNSWYTMTMRSWQEDGHSKFGQWIRDNDSGKWEQVAILDFPVTNVNFDSGSMMFQEDWLNTPDALRSAKLKNGYGRSLVNQSWTSWDTQKIESQEKNDQNWNGGAMSDYFWVQAGGNENSDIGAGATFTIDQPAEPDKGSITIEDLDAVYTNGGELRANWNLVDTSSPQFKAEVVVKDADGNVIQEYEGIKSYQSKFDARPNLPENSELTLKVTDIFDQTTEMSTEIENIVDTTPPELTVDEVLIMQTTVTGKTEKDILVEVFANDVKIASGRSDDKGNYSLAIPAQRAGTMIRVEAKDPAGNIGSTEVKTKVPKPSVERVKDIESVVKGEAVPGVAIQVTIGANNYFGTAGADGRFQVSIPQQSAGTEIAVRAWSGAEQSESTIITVEDWSAPEAPIVDPVTDASDFVTGTAEPNGMVLIINGDGVPIAEGNIDANGYFNISIPRQTAGTMLMVMVTDEAGNMSDPTILFVDSAMK